MESAASLIQAAKNLMNAVIQIVKSSYIACTKYQRYVQSDVSVAKIEGAKYCNIFLENILILLLIILDEHRLENETT